MTFYQRLPSAFRYPFLGNGPYLLIGGGIFFFILGLLVRFAPGIVGMIGNLVLTGYFCAYMLNVVRSSACGDETLPHFPSLSSFSWQEDTLEPLGQIVGTVLACGAPAAACYFIHSAEETPLGLSFWALAVTGFLCFPMALLAVAVFNSLRGLNPVLILRSISRVPAQYAIASAGFFLVVGAGLFLGWSLSSWPMLARFITSFTSLALVAIEMRILGLLYASEQERLAWF